MKILPVRTDIIRSEDSLFQILGSHLPRLREGDVLCVTSKILALCQGRTAPLSEKDACIVRESKRVLKTPWTSLTLTDDGWCANAGVDESNADGEIILLPKHPMKEALEIRRYLQKRFQLRRFGVVITDTRSVPLRVGTIGRAIGWSGFRPLKSYVGKKDLFGRKSRVTISNVADALSASAVLCMGEGSERTPMVIFRNAPVDFVRRDSPSRLWMPEVDDMYRPIYLSSARSSQVSRRVRPRSKT